MHFFGLQIWEDQAGYKLGYHSDRPIIDVSMQIYLYDCPAQYGTSFNVHNDLIDVPFRHNTGYLMKNGPEMLHKTSNVLPEGMNRYSLYAIWSQIRKDLADTNNV
jgi:hypothetical protein